MTATGPDSSPCLAELAALLRDPAPERVRRLRDALLEAGVAADAPSLVAAGALYAFLDRILATTEARGLSDLASRLDIGALAGLVVEEMLSAEDSGQLAERLVAGTLTEGLAVLATRQHVTAWSRELDAQLRAAAWWLEERLWFWAAARRPGVDPATRRHLVEQLVNPLRDPSAAFELRMAIAVRLHLVLLADAVLAERARR